MDIVAAIIALLLGGLGALGVVSKLKSKPQPAPAPAPAPVRNAQKFESTAAAKSQVRAGELSRTLSRIHTETRAAVASKRADRADAERLLREARSWDSEARSWDSDADF